MFSLPIFGSYWIILYYPLYSWVDNKNHGVHNADKRIMTDT